MSTFEGPMLAIRAVNGLAHYTNWIVGHVHSGALGWVGMMTFGTLYWLVPRLWNRELARPGWATTHFWLATIGIVLYTVAMWVAGLMEGLMWRGVNDQGMLATPAFMDIVNRLMPYYWLRVTGGSMYLIGVLMMVWNFIETVRGSRPQAQAIPAPAVS
jgi:cbb3-type cytochrome c oxidase subunit I